MCWNCSTPARSRPHAAAPFMNPQAPSQARRVVLAFAVALAIITYVDRVCIS